MNAAMRNPLYWLMASLLLITFAVPELAQSGEDPVTCGWCSEFRDGFGNWYHGFYDEEGDECGWPKPDEFDDEEGEVNTYCARCGGVSECHTTFGSSDGRCHLACGGGETLALVARDVRLGLDSRNPDLVASAISEVHEDIDVEYSRAAGRIEVFASCDPDVPAMILPIPVDLHDGIENALRVASMGSPR